MGHASGQQASGCTRWWVGGALGGGALAGLSSVLLSIAWARWELVWEVRRYCLWQAWPGERGPDRAYQSDNPPLPSLNPREAPTLPPCVRFAAQVRALRAKLPAAAQTSPTGLVVDRFLRVKGWDGSIIALGDSAVTNQVRGGF